MACSSTIFTLLSIFYYDYVPEDQFQEEEANLKGAEAEKSAEKSEEKSDEKSGETNDGYESEELWKKVYQPETSVWLLLTVAPSANKYLRICQLSCQPENLSRSPLHPPHQQN